MEGKINIFVRVSVSKPSSFIAISSSVDRKAVDCKASPTGSVLDNSLGLSEQDISLYKEVLNYWGPSIPGLGWKRTSTVSLGSSPLEGLIHRVDVGGFILLHAENVGKELELL